MFRGFAQNAYSRFFRENSRRARLCSRLADSGNELRRKLRTYPTHCCARNYKIECYFDVLESNTPSNLMRTLILKAIFGCKGCALNSRKYGISYPIRDCTISFPTVRSKSPRYCALHQA